MRVSVIADTMAEVQSLDKHKQIRKCLHLADHFICRTFEKYGESDEIRPTFDRYDIPASLKQATCLKRQRQQGLIYYRITSSTLITKVAIKWLLSNTSTKDELQSTSHNRTLSM